MSKMETGLDRSIAIMGDPWAAFWVEGWFAGYSRSGTYSCPYGDDAVLQSIWWLNGYITGSRMRERIGIEHALRYPR